MIDVGERRTHLTRKGLTVEKCLSLPQNSPRHLHALLSAFLKRSGDDRTRTYIIPLDNA